MSDYLDANNEELLKDYFSESEMMVDNLESNILAIENDPNNREAIDEIFRAAHTLKGNSATVEFSEISHFAHIMEDLLFLKFFFHFYDLIYYVNFFAA